MAAAADPRSWASPRGLRGGCSGEITSGETVIRAVVVADVPALVLTVTLAVVVVACVTTVFNCGNWPGHVVAWAPEPVPSWNVYDVAR